MKILITTDWYAPTINGVVTSVINLENELIKKGHDVKILTLSKNHASSIKGNVFYVASFSAEALYPNARVKIPLRRDSADFITKIVEWNPDVIHSQCEFSTFLFAKKIAGYLNIPIVHTYHTVYEDYTHYFSPNQKWGKKAAEIFSRKISKYCESIITPTKKTADMLERYNIKCPLFVIPTGINLEKFHVSVQENAEKIRSKFNIKRDDFIIVYIGRLAKEKNIDELIRMHSKISNPHIKLLIVGDGPERSNLQQMAGKYKLSERVVFAGAADSNEIASYYKCGNIFASASTSETQGLTYIEALSCGLPAVCRKDCCLEGVIESGMNGFQYTNLSEYLCIIKKLSEDEKSINLMSANAVRSSDKFGSENFAVSVLDVYASAINAYKSRQ